ncbi:MAG: PHP domain-containing protein, partial [bacterium]
MFSHLHLHTQYSLLEGAIRVKKLVKVLQERGFESCAITDHGNMYGAVEFHHALRGAGLKPILGLGAWVVEGRLDEHQDSPKVQSCALNLLCENREGYQSLTYLSSLGFTQGKLKGVPHLDHSLLEQHAQGLIAFSGSIESEIGQRLLNGRQEEARCLAKWYQELYAGGFFLEVQNTGRPEQPSLNAQVVALAQELGIPLLGTNDCFYLDPDEAEAQYILWLMGQQRRVTDSDVPPQFPPERFLRTEEQMREALAGLPEEALTNTQAIAERCEVDLFNKQYFLPNFEIPQQYTLDSWLEKEAQEGLEKRLSLLYELYHPTDSFEEFRQPYDARLKFELEIIISMKFPGYFLIVADFINWAKNHGVSVGPGRGSGAGSLVAYALGLWFSLKTHKHYFAGHGHSVDENEGVRRDHAIHSVWPLPVAFVVLLSATALVAWI